MNNAPVATIVSDPLDEPDELLSVVVSAVADAEGVSPLELRPLATAIDPDAIEALFRTATDDVSLEFGYHGYRVRVSGDERITVEVAHD